MKCNKCPYIFTCWNGKLHTQIDTMCLGCKRIVIQPRLDETAGSWCVFKCEKRMDYLNNACKIFLTLDHYPIRDPMFPPREDELMVHTRHSICVSSFCIYCRPHALGKIRDLDAV
jgi:hypothetical protein